VTMIRRGESDATTVLLDRRREGLAVRIARSADVPFAGAFALEADRVDGVNVRVHERGRDAGVDVDVEVGTVAARCTVTRYGDEVYVDDGIHSSTWTVAPRFPDRSRESVGHGAITPVPGTITGVLVAAGDRVEEGQVLVILEAMKMEHRVRADADAVVARVLVEVGQSVDSHALVVELADEEPAS
jgi:propionyl-CoA carboxylase alpha chain